MITLKHANLSLSAATLGEVKKDLLNWAVQYPFVCALDNCHHQIDRYGSFEFLLGVSAGKNRIFQNWMELGQYKGSWLMGILPYELKNQFEKHIRSKDEPPVLFPPIPLFEPEIVLGIRRGERKVEVLHGDAAALSIPPAAPIPPARIWQFEPNVSKEEYIATIEALQRHIKDGDAYEINLAQAFSAQGKLDQPHYWFQRLIEISPVPFAAFVRWEDQYLLCASPERFLQLKDGTLRTQPIKGTAGRSSDPEKDRAFYNYLQHSHKEQAENVMIVDLSRNDLYKSSLPHSVEVPHLFEIQAFPQVYQMVSTVEGKVDPKLDWSEILPNTFPPGSMTGAPKVSSMQLIDQYESTGRGIYSGSVGYIQPNGEFDWNVIIRSLIYDDAREYLSYHVGGAITYDSDPLKEYEETLLKASALKRVFG